MWKTVEYVATITGQSCSRLAINGGMAATAFNKSKRHDKYGKEHWLSFGTITSTIEAAGMTIVDFAIIYQMLQNSPKQIKISHMQVIMTDVKNVINNHLEKIENAKSPRNRRQFT